MGIGIGPYARANMMHMRGKEEELLIVKR